MRKRAARKSAISAQNYKRTIKALHRRRSIEYLCVADVKYRKVQHSLLHGNKSDQQSFESRKLAVVRDHSKGGVLYFVLLHSVGENPIDFRHIRNNMALHRYATDPSFRKRTTTSSSSSSKNLLMESTLLTVQNTSPHRFSVMEDLYHDHHNNYLSQLQPMTAYEIEIRLNQDGVILEGILKDLEERDQQRNDGSQNSSSSSTFWYNRLLQHNE